MKTSDIVFRLKQHLYSISNAPLGQVFVEAIALIEKDDLKKAKYKVLGLIRTSVSITSRELSRRENIGIEHASLLLRQIYDKGYLSREAEAQDSGGYEYIYRARRVL